MKKVKLLYFSLTILALISCITIAHYRSNLHNINEIDVIFKQDQELFLNAEIVNKLLIQSSDSVFFQQKDMVDLNKIEQFFLDHPMIKNAELYTVPQGKLSIEIEEREPLVRIQAEPSFYLDAAVKKIPLSQRYTAQVPLFYGEFNEENMQALIPLISKLSSDTFLASEVIDFQFVDNAFVLGLRSFPFDVVWGQDNNFEHKAEKLKRFCAYSKQNKDKTFNRIDLTFDNQVVARHNKGYEKQ